MQQTLGEDFLRVRLVLDRLLDTQEVGLNAPHLLEDHFVEGKDPPEEEDLVRHCREEKDAEADNKDVHHHF